MKPTNSQGLSTKLTGIEVRRQRQKRRQSQQKLAAKCGVSNKTISNIERGLNFPSLELHYAICKTLKAGKVPLVK